MFAWEIWNLINRSPLEVMIMKKKKGGKEKNTTL